MNPDIRDSCIRKILVLSLAGIGDTLMTTPLIHELKEQFPTATIDVAVVWPGSAQLLQGNPYIRTVHQLNLLEAPKSQVLRFLWNLRSQRYDLSITPHPQGRREYRIVTRFIGARRRLSHRYENQSWLDHWLVTDSLPQDYSLSGADNNLALLRLMGCVRQSSHPTYELFLHPREQEWANQWLKEHQLQDRSWLGIHVGSGGTKNLALRRWPIPSWIEFLQRGHERHPDIPIVAFGGPGERDAHQQITAALPPHFLHVPASPDLRHAAALVAHAAGFLSVDTAFMHIAAACRVPLQWVIETPTLNPPVYPLRPDWIRIPNPAVDGRPLDFYRYDGRCIAGSDAEIRKQMESVSVASVVNRVYESFPNRRN